MNHLMDDRDDDMRLPTREATRRSNLREESHEEQDREFTLSTGMVLGIFFALALVCAVFFGFGYSMGRKSQQNIAAASVPAAGTTSEMSAEKPTAGTPAIQSIPGYLSQSDTDAANRGGASQATKTTTSGAGTTVVLPTTPTPTKTARNAVAPSGESAPAASTALPERVERPTAQPRPTAVAPVATSGGSAATTSNYVQIAAVSHQEDADVLLSALKRRGYSVFARPGDTDKLIHVQVGPFASRKDADAMRQKLLGDGYNAIVK